MARAVFAHAGRSPDDVRPVTTAAYTAGRSGVAPRPANSVLSLDRLSAAGVAMPAWPDALAAYLKEQA